MHCVRLLALLCLLALPAAPAPAGAEEPAAPPTIYKWVDENGIAHYTTDRQRIPKGLRDRFDPPAELPAAAPAPARVPIPEAAAPPEAPAPAPEVEAAAGPAVPERDEERPAVQGRDFGAESDFVAVEQAPDLEDQIRRLEDEIQADEEALKALLAAPPGAAPLDVADDGDLRAIAERLPERLSELDALRAQQRSAAPR